ncbi:MAG: transposase, partial [Sphingobacteriia bacterium]|nr:transposase [Sphingobacteriia bacterium]
LVRLLYQRGYSREDILELFRVLDWMLQLPDGLEQELKRELIAFEEQTNMPYITSIERLGRQEGRANMLSSLLTVKFGPLGEVDRRRVLDADAQSLLEWSTRLLSARSCEEVFGAGPRPDSEH